MSALTVPENVVPPDCVIVKVPNAAPPPIALETAIVADPEFRVKLRVEPSLFNVLWNAN